MPEVSRLYIGGSHHRGPSGIGQDYRLGNEAREIAASDRLCSFTP
jgi:hypothetical protein